MASHTVKRRWLMCNSGFTHKSCFYTCSAPNFDCDGDDNVRQIRMIYSVSMFLTTQTFSESYASVKGNLALGVECFSQITRAVDTCLCKFLPIIERIY